MYTHVYVFFELKKLACTYRNVYIRIFKMSTFGYAVATLSDNLYVPYVLGGFSMGKHTEKYPRANPHPQASGGVSAGVYI